MSADNYLEIGAWHYKDPTTRKVAVLKGATGLKALEEITGNGSGGFTISLNDRTWVKKPEAGYYRTVYRLSCGGQVVAGFVLGNRAHTLIDSGEQSSETVSVSGDGLKSLLGDIGVYPVGGSLTRQAQDDRVFSWASPRGIWYDASKWKTPVKVAQYHITNSKGQVPYDYQPAEWPDAPNAWWVWTQAPKNGVTPKGDAYFRTEFTVSKADAGDYSLFIAGDDQYQAFIDAALVVDASGSGNHRAKTERYDFELQPGKHILAIHGRQKGKTGAAGLGTAAVIAVLFKAGDAEKGTKAQIIRQTGGGNWRSLGYPKQEPGWTVGEILIQLLKEGADRGIRAAKWIKPNFTESADSQGVPWTNRLPYSFRVGSSLLDVIEQMETLEVETWIDPATMMLNVAQTRGQDRTINPADMEVLSQKAIDAFVQQSTKTGFTVTIQKAAPAVDPQGIWIDSNTGKPYYGINNLGSSARQNDVLNPTFSTSVNNWSVIDSRNDFVRDNNQGKFVARYDHGSGVQFVRTGAMPASAGQVKSASLVVYNRTSSTRQFRLQLSAYDTTTASGSSIGNTSVSNTSLAPGETKTLTVSGFTLPSGTRSYTLGVVTSGSGTTLTNGDVIFLDNALAETAATPGVYFSGATPGASWKGRSYASASTYKGPNWTPFTSATTIAAAKTALSAYNDYQRALKNGAPIVLRPGWNLTKAGTTGEADITNLLLMKTDDGWFVAQDDESIAKYGPIEGQMTTSTNASQSQSLAKKVFSRHADAEEGSTYELIPRPKAVPFQDFGIGDWVLAPDKDGNQARRRVMSIAVTSDDAGNPKYAIEFDTIFQTKQQEADRMTALAAGSGLGGGFAFATASGGTGTGSPVTSEGTANPAARPLAPTNVAATSVGVFGRTGDPQATVTVTWDFVSESENGDALRGIEAYQVYGRLSNAPDSAGRLYATVDGTVASAKIGGLLADEDYLFWVRALVSTDRYSADSTPLLHHTSYPDSVMYPPTAPTLTTKLGTVTAAWDGKMENGQQAPTSVRYVYAEMGTSASGPWTTIGNTVSTASTIVLTGLTVGTTYYVRLRALDKAGNVSDPSAVASIVVDGVDATDLGQQFQDRIDAIETNASQAQQNAADAQKAAEAAQQAAEDAAEASGGILYQEDKPDASNAGKLWVKPSTKKSYLYDEQTGDWEEITDPDIAAAAAKAGEALDKATQAAGTASNALDQAGQALTSANGKNRVYYLSSKPTGGTYIDGDTWFDTSNDNRISRWSSSANDWVLTSLGNGAFGNIDAGKITTGLLDAGRIASASITSRMLAVGDFKEYLLNTSLEDTPTLWTFPDATSAMDATVSRSGTRSAKFSPPSTTIGAPTILRTNLIIDPRATSAAAWGSNAAGGGDTTTTSVVSGGVLPPPPSISTRVRAASNSGGSTNILITGPDTAVTAGKKYSTAAYVYSRGSTAGYYVAYIQWIDSTGTQVGTTVTSANVTRSSSWVRIALENQTAPTGAVKMRLLWRRYASSTFAVNDSIDITGLMLNEGATVFDYFDGSYTGDEVYGYQWSGTADASTSQYFQYGAQTAKKYYYQGGDIPVLEAQTLGFSGWVRRDSSFNGTTDGSYVGFVDGSSPTSVLSTTGRIDKEYVTAVGTWVRFSGSVVVPKGTTLLRPYISVNHSAGTLWIDDVSVKFQAGATLIADGAITTDKVAANAIKANNIDAGAVTAVALSANSVTADKLAAEAITAKHTITGALIRTAESGARTELNDQGLQVLNAAGQAQVRLGYGIDTGMSVLDPKGTGRQVPLGNQLFGSKVVVRTNRESVSNGSTTAWGSTTELPTSMVFQTPTGRAVIFTNTMSVDSVQSYNFNEAWQYRAWLRVYRTGTGALLTNTYMGFVGGISPPTYMNFYDDSILPANEDLTVRLAIQSRQLFDDGTSAAIGKRTTTVFPM